MIDFITTFNERLYEEYAKKFLETFIEKSDESVRLNIFYDGNFDEIINKYIANENKIRFFKFESKEWDNFYRKFGHLTDANGYSFKIVDERHTLEGPSYRWKAVKFSFKVFSVYLASKIKNISSDLVWIDADNICVNSINKKNIKQFLPNEDELMSYLGRDKVPPEFPHSETGFIGFNLRHEKFNSFIKTAISFYTTGEVFSLKFYHDCLVYDTTREIFQMAGIKFKNLSGEFISEEHPMVKSELGKYFDHLKGQKRKNIGYSPEHPNAENKSIIYQSDETGSVELNFG
tara:strand:- start:158 stop:1024 length:867 start_codon:yes stop_codon:yes gene_type:complete